MSLASILSRELGSGQGAAPSRDQFPLDHLIAQMSDAIYTSGLRIPDEIIGDHNHEQVKAGQIDLQPIINNMIDLAVELYRLGFIPTYMDRNPYVPVEIPVAILEGVRERRVVRIGSESEQDVPILAASVTSFDRAMAFAPYANLQMSYFGSDEVLRATKELSGKPDLSPFMPAGRSISEFVAAMEAQREFIEQTGVMLYKAHPSNSDLIAAKVVMGETMSLDHLSRCNVIANGSGSPEFTITNVAKSIDQGQQNLHFDPVTFPIIDDYIQAIKGEFRRRYPDDEYKLVVAVGGYGMKAEDLRRLRDEGTVIAATMGTTLRIENGLCSLHNIRGTMDLWPRPPYN